MHSRFSLPLHIVTESQFKNSFCLLSENKLDESSKNQNNIRRFPINMPLKERVGTLFNIHSVTMNVGQFSNIKVHNHKLYVVLLPKQLFTTLILL